MNPENPVVKGVRISLIVNTWIDHRERTLCVDISETPTPL
jgi:hypothetical protein